ncbi:hypothetical protein COY07_01720 [Candidatus Peregrinibacteria bacterium CG_4_10_14_0_2_um_filter_43_11]|nr:MAG: hypothetical protein COY07_01720 [Candidatus Peregrinibacteria bacterium CG_4_10_14_0_2_um_filter_43_11]
MLAILVAEACAVGRASLKETIAMCAKDHGDDAVVYEYCIAGDVAKPMTDKHAPVLVVRRMDLKALITRCARDHGDDLVAYGECVSQTGEPEAPEPPKAIPVIAEPAPAPVAEPVKSDPAKVAWKARQNLAQERAKNQEAQEKLAKDLAENQTAIDGKKAEIQKLVDAFRDLKNIKFTKRGQRKIRKLSDEFDTIRARLEALKAERFSLYTTAINRLNPEETAVKQVLEGKIAELNALQIPASLKQADTDLPAVPEQSEAEKAIVEAENSAVKARRRVSAEAERKANEMLNATANYLKFWYSESVYDYNEMEVEEKKTSFDFATNRAILKKWNLENPDSMEGPVQN